MLFLKSGIETPGKTAAVVTPDRVLARPPAARLKRYDLVINDFAHTPVARTVPGGFLDLVLAAVETNSVPPELMALLKHPLARLMRLIDRDKSVSMRLAISAFVPIARIPSGRGHLLNG